MNKTIEFVEKSINKQTKKLEELKKQKEHYEILHNSNSIISYTPKIVSIDLEISNIEFNLEHIKQIKIELEAWEELNKTFEIGVDEQIEEIYIIGKNYYGNERTIWGYSKDGTLKIKKALEKKDE